jgi:hypothetical protein
MAPRKEPEELDDDAQVEREFKQLQIQALRIQIGDNQKKIEQMKADAARRVEDQKALEKMRERRKKLCRHKKGGRNNNFAQGNAPDYSLAINVFPCGEVVVFCTRCQSDWRKPELELKRTDPKAYAEQMAEFTKWASMPTDNSPSGSQIYLIHKEAAAA